MCDFEPLEPPEVEYDLVCLPDDLYYSSMPSSARRVAVARRMEHPVLLHPQIVECLRDFDERYLLLANTVPPLPQAAAPQMPEIEPNESQTISTESLIDVDNPSVRSVPSDFMEQSIQTDTQSDRIDREAELRRLADDAEKKAADIKASAKVKKDKAKAKAQEADNWLVSKIASLSEGQASGIVFANLAAVVGLSAVLGYKAWGLHERNALSWKHAGIGAAVVGAVGVVETVFSR